MRLDRIQPMAKAWQFVRRSSPVVASTFGGVIAGVALVISCQMGPPEGMAQTTTGGGTGGTTSAGTTGGGATSGGANGGTTGGGTTGGGTSGGTTGGCGGSCTCAVTGPITLAGSVKSVAASEDSAQLVSGQLPPLPGGAPGAFDCSTIAQNGTLAGQGITATCIKLADGPFVLTDLSSTPNGVYWALGTAWLFAAPPASSWDASTRAQWFVAQIQLASAQPALANNGMRMLVPSGSSLYAVSEYDAIYPVSFSWSGFKPHQ